MNLDKLNIKTRNNLIQLTFLIFIFTSGIICNIKDKQDIKNNLKYSIAFTTEKIVTKQTNVEYYFYYKGEKYEASDILQYDIKIPDGRYYVEFSSKNPDNCNILEDKPVPDWIKEAPVEGWDSIPYIFR